MELRFFLLLFLFIWGCSARVPRPYVDTFSQNAVSGLGTGAAIGAVSTIGLIPGVVVGSAAGVVVGYDLQSRESLYLQRLDQLRSNGVKAHQEGDQIKLIIAANKLFHENSPRIKNSAVSTVGLIGDFVNLLPATTIQVVGFGNSHLSDRYNLALSSARSEVILKLLQKRNLDSRLMWAQGKGEKLHMGAANERNQRIEIILNPIEHLNFG